MHLESQATLTKSGGYSIKVQNSTGKYLRKYQIVQIDPEKKRVIRFGKQDSLVFGVVLSYLKRGSAGWVIISGITEIKLGENVMSRRGDIAKISKMGIMKIGKMTLKSRDYPVGVILEDRGRKQDRIVKILLHFI